MNQAEAGSITYVFSGTVTNVANAPHVSGSPFNTSQTMSGQMTVSDVTLNNSPYQIQSLTLSIGGYQLSGTGSCSVAFNNNSGLNPPSIIDRFYGYGQVSGAGGGMALPHRISQWISGAPEPLQQHRVAHDSSIHLVV